jgi:hypothetical protein
LGLQERNIIFQLSDALLKELQLFAHDRISCHLGIASIVANLSGLSPATVNSASKGLRRTEFKIGGRISQ